MRKSKKTPRVDLGATATKIGTPKVRAWVQRRLRKQPRYARTFSSLYIRLAIYPGFLIDTERMWSKAAQKSTCRKAKLTLT